MRAVSGGTCELKGRLIKNISWFPWQVFQHERCYNKKPQNEEWKMSKYGVFCGMYFPVIAMNTEIYFIISEFSPTGYCWLEKNSVFGHFSQSRPKSFIRLDLKYGDIFFNQAHNKLFHGNLKSVQ